MTIWPFLHHNVLQKIWALCNLLIRKRQSNAVNVVLIIKVLSNVEILLLLQNGNVNKIIHYLRINKQSSILEQACEFTSFLEKLCQSFEYAF